MKYRRKPIEVEVQQFFPHITPWPEGVMEIVQEKKWWTPPIPPKYGIKTLEGVMEVSSGDYIVTGVAGEKYPVKAHIFHDIYERTDLPVVDPQQLFKVLYNCATSVTLNMNDTFGWACADSEEVAEIDLPKLAEVYHKFGQSGVDAFAAVQRDSDVMDHPAVRTPLYYAAKEYLKDYEFHGSDYMMRKYEEKHPEILEKRKKEQEEQEKEWNRKMEIYAAGHSFFKCIKEWFKKK